MVGGLLVVAISIECDYRSKQSGSFRYSKFSAHDLGCAAAIGSPWVRTAAVEELGGLAFLDWRSGLPFSVRDQTGLIYGAVDSHRFPVNFDLNIAVERMITLRGHRFALRGGMDNLTNQANPSAVNSVLGTANYLQFLGKRTALCGADPVLREIREVKRDREHRRRAERRGCCRRDREYRHGRGEDCRCLSSGAALHSRFGEVAELTRPCWQWRPSPSPATTGFAATKWPR